MVMFKGLTFGGINSKDYGVYIEGESAFNAPQRDVELIEIPGRNGAYVHDMGRYSNIEVSYPAGLFGHSESEFAEKISNFRNAICSKKGYQKLTDDYNPDEYRMGVYSSGLDVKPAILRAGQFELKFNCKPQRFLTSGDVPVSLDSGDTLTNPTLFESKPLLLIDGYGDFSLNGHQMNIAQGAVMGNVILRNERTQSGQTMSTVLDPLYLTGDIITIKPGMFSTVLNPYYSDAVITNVEPLTVQTAHYEPSFSWSADSALLGLRRRTGGKITLTAGTQTNIPSEGIDYEITLERNGVTVTTTVRIAISFQYYPGYVSGKDMIVMQAFINEPEPTRMVSSSASITTGKISVNSTKSALGNLYIDLDIGMCYRIEDDEVIPINTAVILPADLPTLTPGENVITYDNTITDFQVTPRYWKL